MGLITLMVVLDASTNIKRIYVETVVRLGEICVFYSILNLMKVAKSGNSIRLLANVSFILFCFVFWSILVEMPLT